MKVPIEGGFTYRADYKIKEDAYNKLISSAKIFGNDNATTMLDSYLEIKLQKLVGYDRHAMLILKNSTISFETHFPSNFVTITASVGDCEAEVDLNYDKYEEVKTTLDEAFRFKVDILDFIRGQLDVSAKQSS